MTGCSTRLSISSHRLRGRNLTLTVYVPRRGKLKASGKGLSSATKTTTGTETVTLTLHAKRPGHAKRHVHVVFTPAHGSRQTLTVTLRA